MIDLETNVAIESTVRTLLGDSIKHKKATSAAIAEDGTVVPDAVRNAIPWVPHNGVLPGVVSTGANQLRWPFPQGGVIRRVSIDANTAPSGGAFAFTLSGGASPESFTLAAGNATASVPANIVVAPGAWIRMNVISSNGVADVAVTLHFSGGPS